MNDERENAARLADQIVSALSPVPRRVDGEVGDAICYAVRSSLLQLRLIVLNRASLGRLTTDPNGAIKVDYLKRDLLRSAVHLVEYRYPRRSGWLFLSPYAP